ncbi:MAG: hypothetical protein JNM31_08350 [Flavobacteriales bacterium]|nr:hypothetical protein [Flavobacteriales bacterium]
MAGFQNRHRRNYFVNIALSVNRAMLDKDWIIAPALDLELKQYLVLAYLQLVKARFGEQKLYPHLEDLRSHLEHLEELRRQKEELDAALPRKLVGLDLRNNRLERAPLEDASWPALIDEVIAFALPGLQRALREGQDLKGEIAEHIRFEPVGVLPLDPRVGYLLLREGREARAYAYSVTLFRSAQDELRYHSVHTRYVTSYTVGLACHYGTIKSDLVRRNSGLPNPATFVFETDLTIPRVETFLPLAKQLMIEQVVRGPGEQP